MNTYGQTEGRPDSWQILIERASSCPLLAHYFAAYRVFGPDINVSREQFLADLAVALHDAHRKSQETLLSVMQNSAVSWALPAHLVGGLGSSYTSAKQDAEQYRKEHLPPC